MPWMSVSAEQASPCSKPCEAQIERTFDEMDVNKKGYVDEQDLKNYAERHGLPQEYASQFINAANDQYKKSKHKKNKAINYK